MDIVLINPNTTASMTARMHETAAPLVGDDVRLVPLTAATAWPASKASMRLCGAADG